MPDYDVLVIGSGFGGSVTALRLTEKGYRVGILEAGRRFSDAELPKTSWRAKDFLWAPKLGLTGIQRIHVLKDVLVLGGAGVGGGSLNYANTLYVPPQPFFDDPQWAHITDWQQELAPHYDQAQRMLGVVQNPTVTPADLEMQRLAAQFGKADTYHPTPVGVFFGRDGQQEPGRTVPDPFFGGEGPERTGCTECGSCMTGCRYGAKNTLVKNYLYLAEKNGAEIHPLTTVTKVVPQRGGGFSVETTPTGSWLKRKGRTFTAAKVVFAAGTYNTQKLLHEMRESTMPEISPRLGFLTRTNSESILGVLVDQPKADYTQGVAITSSWHPDEHTHIEPCRYGKGSNAMGLLQAPLTEGGSRAYRLAQVIKLLFTKPWLFVKLVPRKWSERALILLVMQTLNNSITVTRRTTRFGRRKMTSTQGQGQPNPTWIPVANEAAEKLAETVGGFAGGTWGDILNIPMTAHFIGGCAISDSRDTGVIDPYHRLWGYEDAYVVDGSALSANLGVNPSLSITAQAERAAALWPNKGELDLRPSQDEPYQRLAPIAPQRPAVPEHAPAALRPVPLGLPTVRSA